MSQGRGKQYSVCEAFLHWEKQYAFNQEDIWQSVPTECARSPLSGTPGRCQSSCKWVQQFYPCISELS